MKNFETANLGTRLEARIAIIVDLGRRRDRLLLSPILDMKALRELVVDYEAADMPYAAEDLRKRVEWYRDRLDHDKERSFI